MQNLKSRLEECDLHNTRQYFILYMLRSLAEQYSQLVGTIEDLITKPEASNPHARLLREEISLKGGDSNGGGYSDGNEYFGNGERGPPMKCDFCGRKVHIKKHWWKRIAMEKKGGQGDGGKSGQGSQHG